MKRWMFLGPVLGLLILLQGCASTPSSPGAAGGSGGSSRYHLDDDRPPDTHFDASTVAEPIPRYEPHSRGGNKSPYRVRGRSYHVLPTREGFVEEGIASWYGLKFHGYHTSNGEVYNMYAFTAAHKHLPLPTYVRVTNLDNGRSLIVRVNDRGPFHEDRIIDLSYAAAIRLGVLATGTARVRVENVTPPGPNTRLASVDAPAPAAMPGDYFLQVGAFGSPEAAERVRVQVKALVGQTEVFLEPSRSSPTPIYRVRVGPIRSPDEADVLLQRLRSSSYPDTILLPPA